MSRGKQQFFIFLFGFLLGVLLLAGGYFLYGKLVDTGKIQGVNLPIDIADIPGKTKVLVSLQRIEKGDELKSEYFQLEERNPEEVPVNSIIDINRIAGERAAFVIDKKEILTDSKLLSASNSYDPDDRLKDYALQGYLVADTVMAGDWIDIEMVRTNGDTFIVLAKKQVKQIKDNKAIIQVTTGERALINYAIAEQNAGMGHIESLLYLDEKQPVSQVTYVPANATAPGVQATAGPVGSTPAKTASGASTQAKAASAASETASSLSQTPAAGKTEPSVAVKPEAQGGKTRQ